MRTRRLTMAGKLVAAFGAWNRNLDGSRAVKALVIDEQLTAPYRRYFEIAMAT